MTRLLDAQISQNISTSGGISIPLTTTPTLFATLGLNTSGAGADLRVQFTGTVGISSLAQVAVPITVDVYRGIGPNRVLVYSVTETSEVAGTLGVASRKILTFTGADSNPPNPGFLIYQAFVSIPGGIPIAPTRTGPESFNAQVYSE
ncbi:hypothetical protein P5G62_011705 [Neobacillus sp. 179-C4.2 HS]|uniref:Exosporium leader peptide n=1 Tax=Neobacillus driksii TaxID=3035913 RepID=A0ABV4YV97_9BACI|nr:hypothetical protein [Neobacillus sp. 179.-C4.2 HS]MDP5194108.1 hypothetical protein [Neobacillus sp. 179.-C4.2 HS]